MRDERTVLEGGQLEVGIGSLRTPEFGTASLASGDDTRRARVFSSQLSTRGQSTSVSQSFDNISMALHTSVKLCLSEVASSGDNRLQEQPRAKYLTSLHLLAFDETQLTNLG